VLAGDGEFVADDLHHEFRTAGRPKGALPGTVT